MCCAAAGLAPDSAGKLNPEVHESSAPTNSCLDVGHIASLDEEIEAFGASRGGLSDHPIQGIVTDMRLNDLDAEEHRIPRTGKDCHGQTKLRRILGTVVASVSRVGPSSLCVGCGSEIRRGEWACERCLEDAGNGYLRTLDAADASKFQAGYDPSLFEKLADIEPTSFWFRGRNKMILLALDRWFPDGRSFLEVGCGTGYVLSAVLRSRPTLEAVGAELFPEGLRVARRRLQGVPLAQMDARSLGIDEAFDVVGAFDVLEHLDRDHEALRAMFKALRPGGGLVVTVPQHHWLWSQADEFAGHARRYTRGDLAQRMLAAGFELLWTTSFLTFLLPLITMSRLVSGRRPYSLDREFGLPRAIDWLFERSLDVERAAMSCGASFPVGGSLLVVARRPHVAVG
jgi:SAM-dependent methyltransferase